MLTAPPSQISGVINLRGRDGAAPASPPERSLFMLPSVFQLLDQVDHLLAVGIIAAEGRIEGRAHDRSQRRVLFGGRDVDGPPFSRS